MEKGEVNAGFLCSSVARTRRAAAAAAAFLPTRAIYAMKRDMNRQDILERLRKNERALRERGVTHAALFGSRAREDSRADSDTDIMIEVDPEAHISVYDYVGLKDYIASLFDGTVDVVSRDGLKSYVRPAATADAIYAF